MVLQNHSAPLFISLKPFLLRRAVSQLNVTDRNCREYIHKQILKIAIYLVIRVYKLHHKQKVVMVDWSNYMFSLRKQKTLQ